MVKSLRSASAFQSVPKATSARRPSVATSRARVRYLIGNTFYDERHGAMVDSRRTALMPGAPPAQSPLGTPGGCQVDVAGRQTHEAVGIAPPTTLTSPPIGVQQVEDAAKMRSLKPALGDNGNHA